MNEWNEAEQLAERAHRFYEAGQWNQALDALRQALHVNPEQDDWQFGLGLTLDALERWDEAAAAFARVIELRGDDPDTLHLLGVDLLRAGRAADAVEVFERLERAAPESPASYVNRIAAYAELGDVDAAETMFYLAQQLDEEDPAAYDEMGNVLIMRSGQGDDDRAMWCWRRCLKLDPRYPDVRMKLAKVYWMRGRFKRARHLFLQELRQDPGHIDALLDLSRLLRAMDETAEAEEKLRRVLEMDPTVPEAHIALGELALARGHVDAAHERFERARRLDDEMPGSHLGLAEVARRRGQRPAARNHLKRELRLEGHEPHQELELARLLVDLGWADRAQRRLDEVLGRELGESADPVSDAQGEGEREVEVHGPSLPRPVLSAMCLARGVAKLVQGDELGGIADCRTARRLNPHDPAPLVNLALAHLKRGEVGAATAYVERFGALSPGDEQLRPLRVRVWRARLRAAWWGVGRVVGFGRRR